MDNNRETQTFDDRGGFTAHPDNPVNLTWDAETSTWMTHQKAGAKVYSAGVDFEFPESWGWEKVMAEHKAEADADYRAKKEAMWTAEIKRVNELAWVKELHGETK
jgi:hypothetical protein